MYNHNKIEKKWQKYWLDNNTYQFLDNKSQKKFYALDMFPYPSGKGLHVGHPKGYTATDIISRFKRLNGFNVLHPIGWDAFGLPAEQYALETNNHPRTFTQTNIDHFRSQLQKLGFCFDYDKEVNTTDPKYFKWTQWIFLQLFKRGLAEIKEVDVNWCEKLGTVLANEEVLIDKEGNRVSERGSHPVVRKPMKQWVLKITEYADKLLEGLEEIDWPESLKHLQKNWIGRMEGTNVDFKVFGSDDKIKVFTTRIDTIYGVSYLALSPKHPLIDVLTTKEQKVEVEAYLDEYNKLSDREIKQLKDKTGVFTGSYAINPINNKRIPIFVSNYVLVGVGTEALMGVPAHDENDFEFAEKFNLDIIPVIECKSEALPYLEDGKHINSLMVNGMVTADAYRTLQQFLINQGIASKQVNYKLRDWLFSRQRYWGEPFPVLFDENNNILADEALPVLLPEMSEFKPSTTGEGPLANATDWLNVDIKGKKYLRDTNTMPQWAGSCWYYIGYLLKNPDGSYTDLDSAEAKERLARWLPVDVYIGGQEHAVLHLLYARFWHRFLYDIGVVPTKEPFYKVINQGMILGEDGEKMSKSKGNVLNPDDIIESHGADALRLYEMFMGPLTSSMAWKNESLDGVRKWLDRVYRLYMERDTLDIATVTTEADVNEDLVVAYNLMVKKVTDNLNDNNFNIGISEMMIFINQVYKTKQFYVEYMKNFAIILSCYAPHLAEEIYHSLDNDETVSVTKLNWPTFDEAKTVATTINIPVVINGKPRDIISVSVDTPEDKLLELALNQDKVKAYINDKPLKKTIVVVNKIVNLII
ncbi:leucine--tRNA ligase [Ureaplasma ceti]|uniref:Leucine--tRNA ligase n=1 Tax=Ureaplasma ceti TaxID=3119530 RepID=A0ABP9UB80_9BACT